MGILNITPDSFYDGGRYIKVNDAFDHAMQMIHDGVDIIDLGGESSRPGATAVSLDEELSRVMPVIEKIRAASDVCISIDTYKSEVMREAVNAGASMINDIMALQSDNALATAAKLNVPVCLMHMHGIPMTMQQAPIQTDNLIDTINQFFTQRIADCIHAGIEKHNLILDPGFGFGKTLQQNMLLTNKISAFSQHQLPILLGVSRKSSLQKVLQSRVSDLMAGGIALAVFAVMNGVGIIRTHDVSATLAALLMLGELHEAT